MAYDPRTIAFFVELLHPPVQPDLRQLQALHSQLFTDVRASYKNFAVIPNGASFSNPPTSPNSNSTLNFFADRIQIREEFSTSSLDEVCARVERVSELTKNQCGIPAFAGEQCVVRSLINPRQFRDSREFLSRALFRFSENDLQSLERPTQLMGLRFVFPASDPQDGVFAVRVESYNGDPRSIYLENVGTFAPLKPSQTPQLFSDNLRSTYQFLTGQVLSFVKRFDRQEEKK